MVEIDLSAMTLQPSTAATMTQPPTDMIAKKRSFTQKLAIQRQVFHEMTSFRKFPLQDMAIRDVEENLKDYLAAATTAADAASGDDVVGAAHSDSDDSEDGQRRQKEVS